jgi:polar amino acid transport system ATP-binding protein
MSDPLVKISGLEKSFGETHVLKGIDLDINRGEVVSLIGPSGSGKTTLLRCINFLVEYEKGSVQIDGEEIGFYDDATGARKRRSERQLSAIRAQFGMVFQLFYLFPHLTALENITLGLTRVRGIAKSTARETASQWLERVGLGDKMNSLPSELSGGQQQRVGIARAVAMEPKVLLLDEITSALDPELVGEVLAVVQNLAKEGMTMIVVTHEMAFARDVGNRVVFMDEGRVVADGSPSDVLDNPHNERLRTFLSRLNPHFALKESNE